MTLLEHTLEPLRHLPGAVFHISVTESGWDMPLLAGALLDELAITETGTDAAGAFMSSVLSDDIEMLSTTVAQAVHQLEPIDCEFRVHGPMGVRWLRANASPRVLADRVDWCGVITDVGVRRRAGAELDEAYQRFRSLVNNLPAGLALKDAEGRFVIVNAQYGAWFGFQPPVAIGQHLRDVHDPGLACRLIALDRKAMEKGEPQSEEMEVTFDGGMHLLAVTSFPILYFGCPIGIGTSLTDVTQRHAAEQAIVAARDAAEAASHSKDAFLANMSHELRTPLNAIIGFSDLMLAEIRGPIGDPEYRGYVVDIVDSGRHLLSIINDILDIAKTEAGELDLLEDPVAVEPLLTSAARSIAAAAQRADLRVSVSVPDGLPEIRADERRLRQIVLNLLSNAVKFTPAGGRIKIAAAVSTAGLTITVADSGIGIAAENLGLVLQPFRQVDSRLARRFEGTGLGLPLSKRLVEMHGGTLALGSVLGEGTTVTVTLPRERLEVYAAIPEPVRAF